MNRASLIVTGDDFGLNSEVNEAVERDYQAGFLKQASLMVNEAGVEEALRIARRNPGLLVGLHLSLCCGKGSGRSRLGDAEGNLIATPAQAGLAYAFLPTLRSALEVEIAAQFECFTSLGLPPVYWDGHTHLHLHPTVLKLTLPVARQYGFQAVRLVEEAGAAPLAIIFRLLSRAAKRKLGEIRYADRIIGLHHTGEVTTRKLEETLAGLPPGVTELYYHPGAEPEQLDCPLLLELIRVEQLRLVNAREALLEKKTLPPQDGESVL